MLGDLGWGERIPERQAPYVGHIRPDVVALMDASYMSIVQLRGKPYGTCQRLRYGRGLEFRLG